jgi:hypothetical protein
MVMGERPGAFASQQQEPFGFCTNSFGDEAVRSLARRLLASGPIMLNPFPESVVINGFCRLQRRVRSGFSPLSVSCRITISRCIDILRCKKRQASVPCGQKKGWLFLNILCDQRVMCGCVWGSCPGIQAVWWVRPEFLEYRASV